jgi:hypothetical protein
MGNSSFQDVFIGKLGLFTLVPLGKTFIIFKFRGEAQISVIESLDFVGLRNECLL